MGGSRSGVQPPGFSETLLLSMDTPDPKVEADADTPDAVTRRFPLPVLVTDNRWKRTISFCDETERCHLLLFYTMVGLCVECSGLILVFPLSR